jgi:two-component system, cell cycle response regulator DivK
MALILVVEDYNDNRNLAELILEDAGHTVVCAKDGIDGVDCATHDHPDLILMDLNLPELDGWEATRRLKANPTTRDIPVIAFTAHNTGDTHIRAFDAGCIDIITKPFDMDMFLAQVTEALP